MRNKKGQFVKGFLPHNKGKKLSDETRKKISISSTGKKLSEAHKLKLSIANKGKKYKPMSEEGKRNISLAHRGKRGPRSIETRRKLSEARKGDQWHTWKGGVSKTNELIRRGLEYRLWRESVFKRDNYTCILCGQKGGVLNADHIKRFADYPKLRFSIDNGRTLCVECHRKTDTYGNKKQIERVAC